MEWREVMEEEDRHGLGGGGGRGERRKGVWLAYLKRQAGCERTSLGEAGGGG